MSESSKDPAIKLFGQNIPVPEHVFPAESARGFSPYNHNSHATKAVVDECGEAARNEADGPPIQKSSEQDAPNSCKCEEMKGQDIVRDGEVEENKKPEDEHAGGSVMKSEQKVLKKPDKILPCPRCDSMDTKFCYFNNYNVKQPRHFCRNCQRYWTAGGTVRNVPVGSGRRKNKQASSLYHQVVLSPPAGPVAQPEVLKSASQRHLSGIGAPISPRPIEGLGDVLNFTLDATLCQSMVTTLDLADFKGKTESYSGSTDKDEVPYSRGSSSKSTDLLKNQLLTKEMKQCGVTDKSYGSPAAHPLQLHPGCPLLYPWNPGWNAKTVSPEASNSTTFYMPCPPLMLSGFCSPNIAVPVVPVANWNCTPRMPFFPSSSCASASSSTTSSGCSGDNTPTLGKHSRDTNLQAEEKTEKSLWVPKSLRVNDPEDAAKSPTRNTLGISPKESANKVKMLNALQSGSDFASHALVHHTDQVLQANPAALSHSQSFQENA